MDYLLELEALPQLPKRCGRENLQTLTSGKGVERKKWILGEYNRTGLWKGEVDE